MSGSDPLRRPGVVASAPVAELAQLARTLWASFGSETHARNAAVEAAAIASETGVELLAARLEIDRLRAAVEEAVSDRAMCIDTMEGLQDALDAPPPDLAPLRELFLVYRDPVDELKLAVAIEKFLAAYSFLDNKE